VGFRLAARSDPAIVKPHYQIIEQIPPCFDHIEAPEIARRVTGLQLDAEHFPVMA